MIRLRYVQRPMPHQHIQQRRLACTFWSNYGGHRANREIRRQWMDDSLLCNVEFWCRCIIVCGRKVECVLVCVCIRGSNCDSDCRHV